MRSFFFFFTWILSSFSLELQSHVIGNIWRSLWSQTSSINHTNYPSPCNIYDNATNDTALIASIPHLVWWPDTRIRKKPVSSRCCSHYIHHLLSFVCDECYIYGALSHLFVPPHHSSSAVHVKLRFCLANRYKQQLVSICWWMRCCMDYVFLQNVHICFPFFPTFFIGYSCMATKVMLRFRCRLCSKKQLLVTDSKIHYTDKCETRTWTYIYISCENYIITGCKC